MPRAAQRTAPAVLVRAAGLEACEVERTAADGSRRQIRQLVSYSCYLPRVSYVVKATYRAPERIDIEEMAGDLAQPRGSWDLRRDPPRTPRAARAPGAPGAMGGRTTVDRLS